MTHKIRAAVAIILIVCVSAGGYFYFKSTQSHDVRLYGNVDIRTVNLGFRVGGRLASLFVDEGDSVEPGTLLGKLDDAPYVNALNEANATMQNAKARLNLLLAGYRDEEITQARAVVAQQQAAFNYAESYLLRQQGLWKTHVISADQLENARSARNQANASLQEAKGKLDQYLNGNRPEEIDEAKATLAQAEATLAQSKLDLDDTRLYSSAAGTVLTRAIEPGTMLTAGATVFGISLTRPVWIRAYVDETHLNLAVPGTKVRIMTDGRPDKTYTGQVGFVSPTAEFTPKSVETPELRTDLVYRLRIIVLDPDDELRQGMPVTLSLIDKKND